METMLMEILVEYLRQSLESEAIEDVFRKYDSCVQKITKDLPVEDKMKLYEAFNLGLFKYLREV